MTTMYHATEADRAYQILRDGLEARQSYADTQGEQLQLQVVYLFATADLAEDFALDNHLDEAAILGVDVEGLDLITDPEYDAGVAYAHCGDIEPARIRIFALID